MSENPQATPCRCAIYLRQSIDVSGEGLAVDRQREDDRALAARRGWLITAEYVDNDVSASGKKRRPGFEQMLADVESGQVNVVVAWSLDRITRNRRDTVRLIEACQVRGVTIALVRGSDIDMSTPAGRLTADILSSVARHEIEQKGDRQKRAAWQRAEMGRPPLGTRLTGYTPAGEVVADEAAIVTTMFERFGAGDSLRSIAAWLDEQAISTRRGGRWNPSSVHGMLVNPRYAGKAIYNGAPTGRPGTWKALVEPELFDVVQVRLSDPRRRTQQGTDRKHLGSSLYECAVCGIKIHAWSGNRYRCPAGCVTRSQGPIDDMVIRLIRGRLARPDLHHLLPADDAGHVQRLGDDAQRLRRRLETVESDYDAGHIDGARYATARAKVRAELAEIQARQAQMVASNGAERILGASDPAAAFTAAPLMIRRNVVDLLCVVKLGAAPRGRRGFDPSSIGDSRWRGDSRSWREHWESGDATA